MPLDRIHFASKFNPIWKKVAKNLSSECERCGRLRLFSIFDTYVSGERPDCLSCSAAYVSTLPLIKRVFSKTNLREEDIKKLMDDMLLRRSMLNVVRGIRHFGLRTPQPTAVPTVIVWNVTNRCNLNCIHCHQDSGHNSR